MALYGLLGLMAAGVAAGLSHWRYALYAMVLIAAVQDPLRKLVPGAPGYLVLVGAPVLAAAVFGLVASRGSWWREFSRAYPRVAQSMGFLMVALIPAALISASYGPGSWMATLLGVFSYSVIIMSIIVGFFFARSLLDIRRLLGFYCLLSAVMLTGGFIEYYNLWPGSLMVGTKALNTEWIRHKPGLIVHMIAGFYRTPDVMGWHAATVVMTSLLLAFSTQKKSRYLWIAVALFAILPLLICGRRKMVYMIPFFVIAVVWVYSMAGRKRQLLAILGFVVMPLVGVAVVGDRLGNESSHVEYYTRDSGDIADQVYNHGFSSLVTTYRQSGFFGSGLGFATPGVHNLPVAKPRTWQESGPSRVMVELGVPGMIGLVNLVVTVMGAAWRVIRWQTKLNSPVAVYAVGLFALFLSNVGSLVVSGQILADPFVAAFLGLSIGMVLSFGRAPFASWHPAVARRGSVRPGGLPYPAARR